jgi:hypothetical protein
VLIILSACAASPASPSLLGISECEPPCWNGIIPGRTTRPELLGILADLPAIDQNSLTDAGAWKFFDDRILLDLNLDDKVDDGLISVEIDILDEKVVDILFSGRLGVTFGEMTESAYDPEKIIIIRIQPGDLFVTALDSSHGISYGYTTQDIPGRLRSEVSPEIELGSMEFFDPAIYPQLLEAGLFSMGHLNAEETLALMKPWVGYGDLKMYEP